MMNKKRVKKQIISSSNHKITTMTKDSFGGHKEDNVKGFLSGFQELQYLSIVAMTKTYCKITLKSLGPLRNQLSNITILCHLLPITNVQDC